MSHVTSGAAAPESDRSQNTTLGTTNRALSALSALRAFTKSIGHDNPLLTREVLTTMRLRSIKAVIIGLPVAITALVLVVAAETSRHIGGAAEQGTTILGIAISTALYVVGLVGAVLGAQSIAGERQAKTLDLIIATGMSPWKIIAGKAMAVWVVLALLILTCLPPLAICFVVGGVSLTQMLLALAVPLATAVVPVAFGLALGTVQRSSKLSVGASAAAVGLIGPMVFSVLWMAILAVVGADRFMANGPFFLPNGSEGFWSLLTGGILMPLFFIVVPTWYFLATAVSSLSNEAGDRAKPLRRWFMVSGPFGGFLVGLIGLVKDIDDREPVVFLLSMLGIVLCFGVLALVGHPAPRSAHLKGQQKKRASVFPVGPHGDALFALIVSGISLIPALLMLTPSAGLNVVWAASIVLAFVTLIAGCGVMLSSLTAPRIARWALVGVGILFTIVPLLLSIFVSMMDPGAHRGGDVGVAGLISPIGAMIQLASYRHCSSCVDAMPGISVALWTVLGVLAWQLGATRLKKKW